jgi:hypothetical protein
MLRLALAWSLSSVALLSGAAVRPQDPPAELKGRVVYVDAKNKFFVISLGKKDGVGPSMEFRVVRRNGKDSVELGKASFEKYLGQDSMAKLILSEGDIREIRVEDEVLCRKI